VGVEEPGSCNPVKHFLYRGESPLANIARETEELEDFEVRACQADIRRIGDVSFVVKKLMNPAYQQAKTGDMGSPAFNPATVHVSPTVLASMPKIIPNSP